MVQATNAATLDEQPPRFRMLETIREFVPPEKLSRAGQLFRWNELADGFEHAESRWLFVKRRCIRSLHHTLSTREWSSSRIRGRSIFGCSVIASAASSVKPP